jgi:hypothetical protein
LAGVSAILIECIMYYVYLAGFRVGG